jgi:putative Holliday junction resolvase
MKILGIDYGRKKIGLAISEGSLAEPWKVIRGDDLIDQMKKILAQGAFDKVIVGISGGTMAVEQESFARSLGAETFDETLTTKEAQRLSQEAGISRKKRREMEDAFAAAIILQNYLDNKG